MARTTTATQDTDLARTTTAEHARVEVQNADDTWINVTSLAGFDWFLGATLSINVDQPLWEARLQFQRDRKDGNNRSLAPLRTDSPLNVDDLSAYAALLDAGRGIRISASVTAPGVAPTYEEVFNGVIDLVDAASETIEVVARSAIGADIVDSFIEDRTEYGSTGGTAIQTVMQSILTDWAQAVVTLWTPSAPGFNITPGWWHGISVRDALTRLSSLIGWTVQEVYDDGTSAWRLRFADPDRTKATIDWTFGPDDYYAVQRAEISRHLVRNAIRVTYYDATGTYQEYDTTDATSISRYGRRFMQVNEPQDSPINTALEAQTMAEAMRDDLKDPEFDWEVEARFFWPAELGDLYRFTANDRHFNNSQDLAVVGIRHVIVPNAPWSTFLQTRGTPVGYRYHWRHIPDTNSDPRVRDVWIEATGRPRFVPAGEQTNAQAFNVAQPLRVGPGTKSFEVEFSFIRPARVADQPPPSTTFDVDYHEDVNAEQAAALIHILEDGAGAAFDFLVQNDAGTNIADAVGFVTITPYSETGGAGGAGVAGKAITIAPPDLADLSGDVGAMVELPSGQVVPVNKVVISTGLAGTWNTDGTLALTATGGGGGGDAWADPVDADIVPDADSTRDLGSSANFFAEAYIDRIFVGVGSAAAPSLSFDGDNDTGVYRSAADAVGIAAGGVLRVTVGTGGLTVNSGVLLVPVGTSAAPGVGFSGDPDTGIYRSSANVLAFTTGGSQRVSIGSSGDVNLVTGNFLVGGATRINTAGRFRAPDGTNALPALAFTSDTDTGVYRVGANSMGFTAGGSLRMTVSSSGVEVVSGQVLLIGDGSAGSPGLAFGADTNTGIFRAAADAISFVTDGGERLRLTSAGLEFQNVATGNDFLDWGGTGASYATKITDQGGLGITADSSIVILAGDTLTAYLTGEGIVAGTTSENLHLAADAAIVVDPNQQGGYSTAGRFLFTTAGTLRAYNSGSAAEPVFTFNSDGDTGIYRVGINQLGIAVGGALALSIGSDRAYVDSRQFYIAEQSEMTRSTAGAITIDWTDGNVVPIRNDGNIDTVNIDDAEMQPGGSYVILSRYATGGQASITFAATGTLYWVNGNPPVQALNNLGERLVITFYHTSGSVTLGAWYVAHS